jgi:hypothetical protein
MQNTSLPANSRRVGFMNHPLWWDEEMATTDRTEYSLAQEVVSHAVQQYCLKLEKLHT